MSDQQDLYGLPLEEFVSARGELAKTLRTQGQRAEAQEIAASRKPSVAAWAVNQLVRTQQREVAALFSAGDALQAAQSQLLAGKGDAKALREAVAQEREAVETLAGKADGLLSAGGHELTQATLDRVSETLHAAALDADARSQAEEGALRRELRHVGLGGFSAVSSPPSPTGQRGKASSEPRTPGRSRDDAAAKQAKREAEQRTKLARAAEAAARRAAQRADRALQTATARREKAAQSLANADAGLAAAAKVARQAAEEHRRAKQALERP